MKRAASILLLLCITFPFWGSYSWLMISKQIIRKEVRNQLLSGMHKEDLVLLTFTRKEALKLLKWEDEKEFEYLGQLYDVVESGTEGDLCWYSCYPDLEESSLNRQIASLVEQTLGNSQQQKEQQKQLITFLKVNYLSNPFTWQATSPEKDPQLTPELQTHCSPGYTTPPSPPPES